jgi:hypothetical protein
METELDREKAYRDTLRLLDETCGVMATFVEKLDRLPDGGRLAILKRLSGVDLARVQETLERAVFPKAAALSPDLYCGIGSVWDLCDQYQVWTANEGLVGLGCAEQHVQDEALTDEQRAWLRGFVGRWDLAEKWEAELCSRLSLDQPERLRQYSVRLDDSESPLLSFAMVNNDSPEVIEALFPANFASGVDVDVGVGLSRQIRLVARVTNEAGADPWWRCICGNDPEYEGFSPSDANGTLQIVEGGGPSAGWNGRHHCCNSCGAYFDRSNLVVLGRVVPLSAISET